MGYWSFCELRTYGVPKQDRKLRAIFRGKRRPEMVASVAILLSDWTHSEFELEGATVAGMRSELCLAGFTWARADQEARAIVCEALLVNGASRPTWAEGQIEHAIERESCKWCRADLTEIQEEGKRGARFCSPGCARSFMLHRSRNEEIQFDDVWSQAQSLVYRSKVIDKVCAECTKSFKPNHDSKLGKYCSPKCYHTALRKMESRFGLVCEECSVEFFAKKKHAKFCGKDCEKQNHNRIRREARVLRPKPASPGTRVARHPKTCPHCQSDFLAKSTLARLCSTSCSDAFHNARKRRSATATVIYLPLTPTVFDEWFRQAA